MGDVKGRRDMLDRVIRHAAKLCSNSRVGQGRKETGPQIVCSRLERTGCRMTANDLTAPLGQGPRKRRRAVNIPAGQIIAVALGLFLGLFVLWAVVGRDPSGGEPVAVAPADLRIAKKGPELVSIPQAAAPVDSPDRAAAGIVSPAPQVKTPNAVTVTIIDGKTGAKREVVVAAPAAPLAPDGARLDHNSLETTGTVVAPKPSNEPNRPGLGGSSSFRSPQ
jgi:hypothetical protein